MGRSTVLMRLEAPMQSWGDGSRFQLRRTADAPTKSGVLGLVLCAGGVARRDCAKALEELSAMRFGVRVDRPGVRGWDFHTAGAGYGILSAEGVLKRTQSTQEPETLLSRREYLFDASFLAGLEGPAELVDRIAAWLRDPVWPVFLGRKCCVPTRPILEAVQHGVSLLEAIAQPIRGPAMAGGRLVRLRVLHDAMSGEPLPEKAWIAYDKPRSFGFMDHSPRWVVETWVTPRDADASLGTTEGDGATRQSEDGWWRRIRLERLAHDHGLCVFCKSEAEEVHHVTYERRGAELVEDLRSLCGECHDACTALEYGLGMGVHRVDPLRSEWRARILEQRAIARSSNAAAIRLKVFEKLAEASAVARADAQRGVD